MKTTTEGPHRIRHRGRLLVAAFVLVPLLLPSNWANMGVRASIWVLAALSLVVLAGWVGQVSLAQGALMGIGAFSAAQFTNHLNIQFPFHALVAGGAAALVATGIGLAALRIRGLYLAIATLAFQWMLEASFLEWHPFSGGFNGIGIRPLKIGPYDFSNDRLFFYLAWAMTALVILLVANLRDSRTGRAWFAIRGSEIAARSVGIDVTRYKLVGFAVSGFIVGIAGSINLNFIGTATPLDYNFTKSITYLAIAVVGGIGTIAGAIAGAVVFIFFDQMVFSSISWMRGKIDIVAAGLLMITLVRNPGGIVTIGDDVKEKLAMLRARRERDRRFRGGMPAPVSGGAPRRRATEDRTTPLPRPARTERSDARPILRADEITMHFGGLVALDGVSLEVRAGEICGLIGPNGAGKTTMFNVVNGLIRPTAGRVVFDGADVTEAPVHERALLGMARTFQIMRLFGELTVFENIMIATHGRNHANFAMDLLMLDRARTEDGQARERVHDVLGFLEIVEYADRPVRAVPFGVLRLVELARALVMQPSLLLLDEPASGLDVAETQQFAEHLVRIRDEHSLSILLIEHDMSLVMDVSDHVDVLDFGRTLASGSPSEVRADPRVIAAYLGEEAVA